MWGGARGAKESWCWQRAVVHAPSHLGAQVGGQLAVSHVLVEHVEPRGVLLGGGVGLGKEGGERRDEETVERRACEGRDWREGGRPGAGVG